MLLAVAVAAASPGKTHPNAAEQKAMRKAVPAGQHLCYPQNAWISGTNPHYAVIVTQATCGGSTYVHQWLRRAALSVSAGWTVVSVRSGTIDHPAGCTRSPVIPADIKCL